MIERAIDRGWDVIRFTDKIEESEGRKLLALCILSEVRIGEDSHVKLANKAIIDFRVRRERDKFLAGNRPAK
jgi:hypothetical protein